MSTTEWTGQSFQLNLTYTRETETETEREEKQKQKTNDKQKQKTPQSGQDSLSNISLHIPQGHQTQTKMENTKEEIRPYHIGVSNGWKPFVSAGQRC